MTSQEFFQHIRSLVLKGDIDPVLMHLQLFLANNTWLEPVIEQTGRFADLRKQIRSGTVDDPNTPLTSDQIRLGLFDLLAVIENAPAPTNQNMISNSKNIVSNSQISAGGNVHIGDNNSNQNAEKIYNISHIDNASFS